MKMRAQHPENLWEADEVEFGGEFVAINTYIR